MIASREICKLCYHANPIGFQVPDAIWHAIVPDHSKNGVVCISCFARLGDEKMVAWDRSITLFPVSMATHLRADNDAEGAAHVGLVAVR